VSERALREYVDRLENGSGQPSVVLGPGHTDATPATDTPTDTDESSTNETDAKYVDASVDDVLNDYRQFATSVLDRSENTVDLHTRYIERLLEHADTPPAHITQDDITDYLDSEGDVSDATRMNIIGALRVFFRDFLDREVMDAFEMPSKSAKPTDVPSKEDLQTFYEALEDPKYKAAFLFAATSGLRSSELCQLTMDDIDEDKRMIVPDKDSKTKQTWVTFYNDEAAEAFEAFKPERDSDDERVFQTTKQPLNRKFRHVSEAVGVKVTVQKLRRWFATKMSRCGVDAKYIDAFCGRTPSSVLEKHYLDYSPERLKEIYDEAGIAVLE
jgi:integrase